MLSVSAVQARGLVKSFGDLRAVDGIDLDVPRGMIFAILGPNGAGKTTLMRMLATLTHPDEGAASIMGHDLVGEPHAVRGEIAMTGQFASLDEDLTGRENLVLLARLWGFRGGGAAQGAPTIAGRLRPGGGGVQTGEGLFGRHASPARYRRLAHRDAGVLFLDEPTTGLDPMARKSVWRMIRAAGGLGRHDSADHAVPGRGRPARRADRRHRSRQEDRRRDPRELKVATGSGFLHVAVADPARLERRRRLLEAQLGGGVQRSAEGATLAIVARSAA